MAYSEDQVRLTLSGLAYRGFQEARATRGSSVEAQIETIVGHWVMKRAERADVLTQLRKAESRVRLDAVMLRRPWQPAEHREELELLTFLRTQAESSAVPLDVVVTGHSKGGALPPTVALWLAETRDPQAVSPTQCWDPSGRAKVRCYAFAGPTPGNAAFATRVERKLDQGHHRIVNTNDVVTHAWDTGGLTAIPGLYGARSALLGPAVEALSASVRDLHYTHATTGVVSFAGELDARHRLFPAELIHQHMDAYLERFALKDEMSALTFFVG